MTTEQDRHHVYPPAPTVIDVDYSTRTTSTRRDNDELAWGSSGSRPRAHKAIGLLSTVGLFPGRVCQMPKAKLVIYTALLFIVCIFALFFSGVELAMNGSGTRVGGGWAVDSQDDLPGAPREPRILLVSAYYPLSKSKHSDDDYASWLELFLSRIQTDTYFYTPEQFRTRIENIASKQNITSNGNRQFTLNNTYTTPFSIPPLWGLHQKYDYIHTKDREKAIHGPELYAVWNAKAFFLDEAVKHLAQTEKEYDYVFWIDAGSFRSEHAYKAWPNPTRVDALFKGGKDRVFIPIQNPPSKLGKKWAEDMGPFDEDVSEGSFFGGTPTAVSWFRKTFYAYHDYYLSLGYFVGKDQTLFNALLLLFPSRFLTVWMKDPTAPEAEALQKNIASDGLKSKIVAALPGLVTGLTHLGRCKDEWYYYHFLLADETARNAMRDKWDKEDLEKSGSWKSMLGLGENRWVEKTRCRATRSLRVEDVLEWKFGNQWSPSAAKLKI